MKTKFHGHLLSFQLYLMTLSFHHSFLSWFTSLMPIIYFSKILRLSLVPDQFPTPFKITILRFPVLELSLRKLGYQKETASLPTLQQYTFSWSRLYSLLPSSLRRSHVVKVSPPVCSWCSLGHGSIPVPHSCTSKPSLSNGSFPQARAGSRPFSIKKKEITTL